jgi:hypothetical protein
MWVGKDGVEDRAGRREKKVGKRAVVREKNRKADGSAGGGKLRVG